jgi:hypothetical protein
MKTGSPAKGSEILNSIIRDRVPRRHKKIVQKVVKQKREYVMTPARQASLERLRVAAEARAQRLRDAKLNPKTVPEPEPEPEDTQDDAVEGREILTKKERKLKDDLIWVLQKLGGREKILKRAKKSDALQDLIIKELLKVEVKELETRLRLKIPQGQSAGFYFVISGLHDENKIKQVMGGADVKFLENVLHPEEKTIDIEGGENES